MMPPDNNKPEQSLEEQIFDQKVEEFIKRCNDLQAELGVFIVPKLAITQLGISPQIMYVNKDAVNGIRAAAGLPPTDTPVANS